MMTIYRDRQEAGEYAAPSGAADLDLMTKDQLLDAARGLGLDVTQAMSKAEIKAAIEEA